MPYALSVWLLLAAAAAFDVAGLFLPVDGGGGGMSSLSLSLVTFGVTGADTIFPP